MKPSDSTHFYEFYGPLFLYVQYLKLLRVRSYFCDWIPFLNPQSASLLHLCLLYVSDSTKDFYCAQTTSQITSSSLLYLQAVKMLIKLICLHVRLFKFCRNSIQVGLILSPNIPMCMHLCHDADHLSSNILSGYLG